MIYCIPLDEATEEFYASVARAAGLPIEQVLRDTLFKLAGELALEALARRSCKLPNKVRGDLNGVVISGGLCYHADTYDDTGGTYS